MPDASPPSRQAPDPRLRPAGDMLRRGWAEDRAGRLDDAVRSYEQAVRLGEASGERAVVVEALRRLGVVHHRRNAGDLARQLCRRSHQEAERLDRKSTRLNSSHGYISYAVFCLKKKT